MTFFGGSSHRIVKFALVLITSALVLNQIVYIVSNWIFNEDDQLPKQSFYGNNVQHFVDPLVQILNKNEITNLRLKLLDLKKILDNLIKISLLNHHGVFKEAESQTCGSQLCSLIDCGEEKASECREIFQADRCEDMCFCDFANLEQCDFYDLSKPENEESYTGYQGDAATKEWKLIEDTAGKVTYGDGLLSKLLSGIRASIDIQLSLKNCYDPSLKTYQPNFETFWKKIGSPERFKVDYLKNLLLAQSIESFSFVKTLLRSPETLLNQNLLSTNPENLKIVQQTLKLAEEYNKTYNVLLECTQSITDAQINDLKLHKAQIKTAVDTLLKIILSGTKCSKCRLFGSMQTQGLGTAVHMLTEDSPSRPLATRELITLLHSNRKLTSSVLTMLDWQLIFSSKAAEECVASSHRNKASKALSALSDSPFQNV